MLNKFRKILLLAAIFFIVTKAVLALAIFLYPNYKTDISEEISAQKLINLTNYYRHQKNLPILAVNARLNQAAVNKAKDLLTRNYFAHTSPDGKRFSSWIKDVGYKYFYAGENLAIDFSSDQAIFNAWLESPAHKENIINPHYQEIGLAALTGKYKNHQTTVVVQLFGTRVLGATETAGSPKPIDYASHYVYAPSLWQKLTSYSTLDNLNYLNNYFLVIFLGLALITYQPYTKKTHTSIKQPIINRYQAKTFKE